MTILSPVTQRVCSNCKHSHPADDRFCPYCGTPVHAEMIMLLSGGLTDVGRVRDLNEDSLVMRELLLPAGSAPIGIYVVADGMGGHSKGEIASRMATHLVAESLAIELEADTASDIEYNAILLRAVQDANEAIYQSRITSRSDMGTTIVCALVVGLTAYIASVGDSRAYVVSSQGIKRITTDHSYVQRLVASGNISESAARFHPQRNKIYKALGDQPPLEVDMFVEHLQSDQSLCCVQTV